MRWLTPLLLLIAAPVHASCIGVPLEQAARESRAVFMARIASASTSDGLLQSAESGPARYSVHHSFLVTEVFSGMPELVTTLTTGHVRQSLDPAQTGSWGNEERRLIPGEDVLVFATALGEVDVSTCTPSAQHPPTPETLAWLRQWREAGWPAATP